MTPTKKITPRFSRGEMTPGTYRTGGWLDP
jgi:hypothetical protein